MNHIKTKLLFLALILSLFFISFFSYGGLEVNSSDTAILENPPSELLVSGKEIKEEEDELDLSKIPPLEGLKNILLLGVDNTEDVRRSDTMVLVSIDPVNNELKMASFLRDNYVNIPGYGNYKLNASYSLGGPELVMKTINENFGTNLEDYVLVDFASFADIIDLVGGIDVSLSKKEAEQIFGQADFERFHREGNEQKEYFSNTQVMAGDYHLDGEETLTYCRIRKIDDDFGRTNRQRIMLEKVYEKFKEMDALGKLNLGLSALGKIETNIGAGDFLDLLKKVIKLGDMSLHKTAIPAEGAYQFDQTADGQEIISLDLNKNKKILYEFINTSQKEKGDE